MYFSMLVPSIKATAWDAFPLQKSRPLVRMNTGAPLSSLLSVSWSGQEDRWKNIHPPPSGQPTVSLTCRGRAGFIEDASVAALDGNLKAEDVECPCLTIAAEKDPSENPTLCWVLAQGEWQ